MSLTKFKSAFLNEPSYFFVSPGRLEVIGNHTDHNHGVALVASASLYILAAVKPRKDNIINVNSKGSKFYNILARKEEPNEKEFSTTHALIKGVVNGFINAGYKVGGFDAYSISEVPTGGGVSSSAAFELLIATILNTLYNDNKVSKIEMAKFAQYSEVNYFHKPCGMLDQIGCVCGGISYIDFLDPNNPTVKNISFPFDIKIVLTNPGGSHSGLDSYYASIPNDMYRVAHALNHNYLRESNLEKLVTYIKNNEKALSPREINRAIHFYNECERVHNAYKALLDNDLDKFLMMINESGYSSSKLLKNTFVKGRYNNSPEKALSIARKIAPRSAHRVHGGGFMGTIISFVRNEDYISFMKTMKETYGENNVINISISPFGSIEYKNTF